jgi:hypothetical protein
LATLFFLKVSSSFKRKTTGRTDGRENGPEDDLCLSDLSSVIYLSSLYSSSSF